MSNICDEFVKCPHCHKKINLHYRQKIPDLEIWVAEAESMEGEK